MVKLKLHTEGQPQGVAPTLGECSGCPTLFLAVLVFVMLFAETAASAEMSKVRGYFTLTMRGFSEGPVFSEQSDVKFQPLFNAELRYQDDLSDGRLVKMILSSRIQPTANQHFSDHIREAWIGRLGTPVTWKAGILNERWGVLEAENIVDIINPRDFVEDFQGDAKSGIPGVSLSYADQSVKYRLWLLPYAREQRLAEGLDRFRVATLPFENPQFESGRSQPSAALRISTVKDDLEIGFSHFHGHARFPRFEAVLNGLGPPTKLTPIYDRIDQTSLDLLWVGGGTLLKLEGFGQAGEKDDFFAIASGIEHEVPALFGTRKSLTFLTEFYYDGREPSADIPLAVFQEDVFVGLRFSFNDLDSTEAQIRLIHDLEYDSFFVDLRASRRLNGVWNLETRLNLFIDVDEDPALMAFRDDSHLELRLTHHF
ncbi:MAG: hypothetical protein AAB035_01085 [Nitrospirota bacterium]